MTEVEFEERKALMRATIRRHERTITEARKQIEWCEDELMRAFNAAQQEPWFGEAND